MFSTVLCRTFTRIRQILIVNLYGKVGASILPGIIKLEPFCYMKMEDRKGILHITNVTYTKPVVQSGVICGKVLYIN